MLEDENHRRHLALLTAISQVSSDLPRAAALLADAADDAAALSRLREAYGLTAEQAEGVLDQQLWLLTGARRAELENRLQSLREALASTWDPPLTVEATIESPRRGSVMIEGEEHRVQGQRLGETVKRIVDVVREQVALPHRRRVSVDVDTGVAKAPARILIDPVSSARYLYQDDETH
jgi:DNA gyrase/topoisomerase IV subunit A